MHGAFWTGPGAGLVLAIYDYLGYNTAAYLGAEIRDPGRTLPRAIIYAIVGIMVLYLLLQVGVLGTLPWQQITRSTSVASLVLAHTWGVPAAKVLTVFIIVTALASVFAGLLGGSRVPYEAARDRLFLRWFGALHPRLHFPHIGLLVLGVITAIGTLFNLSLVINMLTAVFVLVQSIAQIVALVVLRRSRPDMPRPYRQWLYPVPAVLALIGWVYVYVSANTGQDSLPWIVRPVQLSLVWLVAGVCTFLLWAKVERTWPFGPKDVPVTVDV